MVVGYAAYDSFLYGTGFMAALSGIGNLIQGGIGIAAGVVIIRALSAAGLTAKFHAYTETPDHHLIK